jgi:cyclic beta-1,2-glucan synthetase
MRSRSLARGAGLSELDVARAAVARASAIDRRDGRQDEPGFCLVGRGRKALELALGFRAPLATRLLRACVEWATPLYLGTIAVLTLAILSLPLLAAWASGAGPVSLLVLARGGVPGLDLAIALLNRGVTAADAERPTAPRASMVCRRPANHDRRRHC